MQARLAEAGALAAEKVITYRGGGFDSAGDGVQTIFDGPARAIHCAHSIGQALRPLKIEIRAGLDTGEYELMGGNIGGIAVHIGSRLAALAGGGEIIASSNLKDLVAGSGIDFAELGSHMFKGESREWRIYRVASF